MSISENGESESRDAVNRAENTLKLPRWFCHQRPDRSFFIRGRQFPLCARCTGFYAAAIAGFLVYPFFPLRIALFGLMGILIVFTIPMALDGTTQLFGWRESNNALRFITGILGGFWCGFAAYALIENALFGSV